VCRCLVWLIKGTQWISVIFKRKDPVTVSLKKNLFESQHREEMVVWCIHSYIKLSKMRNVLDWITVDLRHSFQGLRVLL